MHFFVDKELIKTFVNNYKNSLKSFRLRQYSYFKEETFKLLLQNISRFYNLEDLELFFRIGQNRNELMAKNFKSIAIGCNQIRNLRLYLKGSPSYLTFGLEIVNSLQFFQNLRILKLDLNLLMEERVKFNSKSFKYFKQLFGLHLDINLGVNDIFFEDIDKHLPQLKRLDITVDNSITDKAMNSLSKLSKLQILCILSDHNHNKKNLRLVTDSGLLDVINNCPQINSIRLKYEPNITRKTIDALIALALRKPHIQLKHSIGDIKRENNYYFNYYFDKPHIWTAINLKSFDLPKNLIINSFKNEINHLFI
jgi:hypothetical protein